MNVTSHINITRMIFSPEDGEEVEKDLSIEITGDFYRGYLEDWLADTAYVLTKNEGERAVQTLIETYEDGR